MTVPQAAFALQNFCFLVAGAILMLAGDTPQSRGAAFAYIGAALAGQIAVAALLVIDARTAELEASAEEAEQQRLLAAQPNVPSPT